MPTQNLSETEQELKRLLGIKQEILNDNKSQSVGKLYLMVGLPGSGKTTYAIKSLSHAIRVCHDDLYRMMTGVYRPELRLAYHTAEDSIIINSLAGGWDVVIDRTCLDVKTRQRFIKLAHDVYAKVEAVIMDIPIELAKKNNLNPDRLQIGHFVSDEVFSQLLSRYEPVSPNEGFIDIKYVSSFNEI